MSKIGKEISDISLIRLNEAAPVIGDTAMETLTETIITDSSMIGHNPSTPAGVGQAVGEILRLDESRKAELDTVMRNLAETLRIVSILIVPFMHTTSDRMRDQLGLADVPAVWEDAFEFYQMDGAETHKGEILFPRLDIDKELEELYALSAAAKA
jgi:hypothetical protein